MSNKLVGSSSIILNGETLFSPSKFTLIPGPCAIESYESFKSLAKKLKGLGTRIVRAGTYKLRTQPTSFQGLGEEALKILSSVTKECNMFSLSEITDIRHIDLYKNYVDFIMVGARNMYNYALLQELSKISNPIILKRAFSATIEEVIGSCKYLMQNGKTNIIICERGIRTFEPSSRFVLDLNGVLTLKELTNLNIICDPSHASGKASFVLPLTLASKSVGANGAIIEVHPSPLEAKSDADQQLTFEEYSNLVGIVNEK
jgi:3-deoxy-7-phosphoheptulonate synthase